MKKAKIILVLTSLLISISLLFTLDASAQMFIEYYNPAATATPAGSYYYVVTDPMPYNDVTLSWQFSKGMDGKFVQDISNITVKEKGSSTEITFNTSAGTTTSPAPGYEYDTSSLLIQNPDFTYLKVGSGTAVPQYRLLTLKPTTVTFDPNKTYVVTIDNSTTLEGGTTRTFQANNNNILQHVYSFEFQTTSDDIDADGIADNVDNCPTVCNPRQLDADTDNIGDVCDATPNCGWGCGQAACELQGQCDADGDGIVDADDNCPNVYNPQQLDANSNGTGDCCDTAPGCGGCGQTACDQQCTL